MTNTKDEGSLAYALKLIMLVVAIISASVYMNTTTVDPISFTFPPSPVIDENDILDHAQYVSKNTRLVNGPESLAFSTNGPNMYYGTVDGRLMRTDMTNPEVGQPEVLGVIGDASKALPLPCGTYTTQPICGRPLGMKFAKGDLYFVDSYLGLYKYNEMNHQLVPFKTHIRFANDIAIDTKRNKAYITSSSHKYDLNDIYLEVLEARGNGAVYEIDLKTGKKTKFTSGLFFPNGVEIHPSNKFLIVAETTRGRLIRIDLIGKNKGKSSVLVDNLPYLPDNLAWVGDELWVAGSKYRGNNRFEMFSFGADKPWLRKLVAKILPERYQNVMSYFDSSSGIARVKIDLSGMQSKAEVIGVLMSKNKVRWLSALTYHDGYVYMGSYHTNVHGVLRLAWDIENQKPIISNGRKSKKLRRKEFMEMKKKREQLKKKSEL